MRVTLLIVTVWWMTFPPVYGQEGELADIRPAEVRDSIDIYEVIEGQSIMDACIRAHGWHQSDHFKMMRVRYTDDWSVSDPYFHQFNNWPDLRQQVSQEFVARDLGYTRAWLINGSGKGQVWGVRQNSPYKVIDDRYQAIEDSNMRPALVGKEYFVQLPYWLQHVLNISYVKDSTFNGESYHLLFGTWDDTEPNPEFDQYVYWINKETFLLEMVQYTVRAVGPKASGYVMFKDYRNVEGVMLSFDHQLGYLPGKEGLVHRMIFNEIAINPKDLRLSDLTGK